MLPFQKFRMASMSPPKNRSSRSASHARIHAFNNESPRSHGMSRVMPAARGQVNTSATATYRPVAARGLGAEGLALLVFSSKSCNQVPNLIQLLRRRERDHAEVS